MPCPCPGVVGRRAEAIAVAGGGGYGRGRGRREGAGAPSSTDVHSGGLHAPARRFAGRRRPGGAVGMQGGRRPAGGRRHGRCEAAEMAMVGVRCHGVVERKRHKFVGCNTVGIAVLRLYL